MYAQLTPERRHEAKEIGLVPGFLDLAGITQDALRIGPPTAWVQGVLGPPKTWLGASHEGSEFQILDRRHLARLAGWLLAIGVPSIPRPPDLDLPGPVDDLIFHPTVCFQQPDPFGSVTSFPQEQWFFINGILTNRTVAEMNAACIASLFFRPVTVIQNSTDGFGFDLLECSLGKQWYMNVESAQVAFPAIYKALKDPGKERVVVVCHSQGTIIMAVVLRGLKYLVRRRWRQTPAHDPDADDIPLELLANVAEAQLHLDLTAFEDLRETELAKLEIYCFANCANRMRYLRRPKGCPDIPWIENFANEKDLVARLGMLAPSPKQHRIRIDGPKYVRPDAWGHLLNEHYLLPIADAQQKGYRWGRAGGSDPFVLFEPDPHAAASGPRLFDYINGGTPDPLPANAPRAARSRPPALEVPLTPVG